MKKDALKRYTSALNEMLKDVKTFPTSFISGIGEYAKVYGMSSDFFSFLVHHGTLIRTGKGRHAEFTFSSEILNKWEFTETQVNTLMLAWNHYKKAKVKDEGAVHDLQNNSKFAGIETQEIFAELKRRGYSGTLEIVTRKVINI